MPLGVSAGEESEARPFMCSARALERQQRAATDSKGAAQRQGVAGGPVIASRPAGGLFKSNGVLKRASVLEACVTKSG